MVKTHLCKPYFQSSKHFWKVFFGIAKSYCFDFSFFYSIVEKLFPLIGVFSFTYIHFGKRKKSTEAKSGGYSSWSMITVLFLVQNLSKSIDIWAGALSWCIIHDWFFHNSRQFLTDCFAQSAHNFIVVVLINRTTLWHEFIMHNAIAIEENSEQNLHIWMNFTWFFRS